MYDKGYQKISLNYDMKRNGQIECMHGILLMKSVHINELISWEKRKTGLGLLNSLIPHTTAKEQSLTSAYLKELLHSLNLSTKIWIVTYEFTIWIVTPPSWAYHFQKDSRLMQHSATHLTWRDWLSIMLYAYVLLIHYAVCSFLLLR